VIIDAEYRAKSIWNFTTGNPMYQPVVDALAQLVEAQYRFLFSLFRNLAGKGNESTAMAVVFGREVSEDNRPGSKITKQLLDILPEARGRGDDRQANENYRADIAAIITQIGQMIHTA
jgi:hypothetical protein